MSTDYTSQSIVNTITIKYKVSYNFLPESKAAIQISAIEHQARPFVETYRSGKHIAYHRSIEINVSVSTETVTETVYKLTKESEKRKRFLKKKKKRTTNEKQFNQQKQNTARK